MDRHEVTLKSNREYKEYRVKRDAKDVLKRMTAIEKKIDQILKIINKDK